MGVFTNLDDYTEITVEEAWNMLNDSSNGIQIPIDVRTDSEWKNEHIDMPPPENPIHYALSNLEEENGLQEFMSLYGSETIILYCRTGHRSSVAAGLLVENNFPGTIYNMLGGITEWKAAGYPTIANQPPEMPTITGSANGKSGEEYEYTLITNDPDGDDVFYCINWSDDTGEVCIGSYESGEEVTVSHIWNEKGTYTIKVKARDIYDDESDWATLEVSMPKNMQTTNNDNNPPNPPMITGPTSGKIGETYLYNVTITDPDEDVMFNLEVDFGDGIVHEDCGCGQSWQNGTVVELSHKWRKTGSYGITARVQDAYGEWSEWSEPLSISMPKSKTINTPFLRFLENHPHMFPLLRQLFGL
jgi:carboxyl-terminal processing protease